MINRIFAAIIIAGASATTVSAFVQPKATGATLGATGAALAAAAVASEARRKTDEQKAEAMRVAQAFRYLYDKYNGVISPYELSFLGEIAADKSVAFLETLAESQDGQRVENDQGLVYSFPHPQNALDQLTKNAQAWVQAQMNPLMEENKNLRQAIQIMQAQTATPVRPAPFVPTPAVPKTAPPEDQIDPWNNLL